MSLYIYVHGNAVRETSQSEQSTGPRLVGVFIHNINRLSSRNLTQLKPFKWFC